MAKILTALDVLDRIEGNGVLTKLVIDKLRERQSADPDFTTPSWMLERLSMGEPLSLLRPRNTDLSLYLGKELTTLLAAMSKIGKRRLNVQLVKDNYKVIFGKELDI